MKKDRALWAFRVRGKRRKFVVFKPSILRFSVMSAIVILYMFTMPKDSIYLTNELEWSWNCLYEWCLFSEYNSIRVFMKARIAAKQAASLLSRDVFVPCFIKT